MLPWYDSTGEVLKHDLIANKIQFIAIKQAKLSTGILDNFMKVNLKKYSQILFPQLTIDDES
jgi:hypothetical protein